MIFRISAKLGKKIHVAPAESLPLASNPFADWSGHLFVADRTQYILITNTASLYSVVLYGKGITNDSLFINRALSVIGDVLMDDGHEFIYHRLITPATARISFSKALNRSVTGSMNDLVESAKVYLAGQQLSPHDASFRINKTPMGYLKYAYPRDAFPRLTLPDSGYV